VSSDDVQTSDYFARDWKQSVLFNEMLHVTC